MSSYIGTFNMALIMALVVGDSERTNFSHWRTKFVSRYYVSNVTAFEKPTQYNTLHFLTIIVLHLIGFYDSVWRDISNYPYYYPLIGHFI